MIKRNGRLLEATGQCNWLAGPRRGRQPAGPIPAMTGSMRCGDDGQHRERMEWNTQNARPTLAANSAPVKSKSLD